MEKTDNRVIDINNDVKWIGILDYDIKVFDIVMSTEYGTTYNSYFINAEKKAIVEVAKEKFFSTYLDKLKTVTNPADIQYIILDHTEPDHSGSLKILLDLAPSATVVGSGNAIRYLQDIVNKPFRSMVVKDGDTLDLGNKTVKFIAAPNLHWPDSIYTYLVEDKILFTCDSFGAHYCSEEMFSDFSEAYTGAFKYYFDVILKPFSRFMLKAIDKIKPLDIDFICTGHGPVHHKNIKKAIDLSVKYSTQYLMDTTARDHKNILIAYVSAYGYTKEAAGIIAEGISETKGLNVEIVDIENIDLGDLDSKILNADGILVGSPTINQNTLLPVYKLFALINPIRDKGKIGGAFGSFGWSGEASKIILENLRLLKLNVFEKNEAFKFAPGKGPKKESLKEFGRAFAEKFIEEYNKKKEAE
ncbi:MAG TPA: FprA family A-type flavoprotein [Bacteroidales bacterium]|nr:FprA family A-type flavoprotein [Bacteroidales bacterium]HPT22721.1 FprA family A-type flavoprotein [Bacteroidales bacterium]